MAEKTSSVVRLLMLLCLVQECLCQICLFQNLKADCRYRVDGISMIHIMAEINQCNSPIDITFTMKSYAPYFKLDWSYTFTEIDETADIPGFDVEVGLHVKHGFREGNKFTVQADFIVENESGPPSTTKFIHEEINIIPDGSCLPLTSDSIIAISVLVPVFVLAAIALITVLVMWRRSVRQTKLQTQTLVNNAELPGRSTPPVTFRNGSVSFEERPGTLDSEMQPDFSNLPGYDEHMRY